jgi:hypothetical protein
MREFRLLLGEFRLLLRELLFLGEFRLFDWAGIGNGTLIHFLLLGLDLLRAFAKGLELDWQFIVGVVVVVRRESRIGWIRNRAFNW